MSYICMMQGPNNINNIICIHALIYRSAKSIPPGGVIIDLFSVTLFSFGVLGQQGHHAHRARIHLTYICIIIDLQLYVYNYNHIDIVLMR